MASEQINYLCVFIFTHLDYLSSQEVVRNYKNFTLFELHGVQTELLKIIEFIDNAGDIATYELGRNISHILVSPQLKSRFETALNKTNLKIIELSNDYEKEIAAETKLTFRNKNFSFSGYYDVTDIYGYLTMIQARFSLWTDLVTGGQSYEGRKILGLRICILCKTQNSGKPIIIIEAGSHAREWISPAVVTYLIHELLHSKKNNIMHIRNTFEWHIFPVINPDGYHYSFTKDRMWRKTRSKTKNPSCFGVDLNRNFDYHFGSYGTSGDPCDYQIYHGERAFSEIESRSLSQYVASLKKKISYLSVHSYSWGIMFPYSDSIEPMRDYSRVLKVAKHMTRNSYIKGVFGGKVYYQVGTSAALGRKVTGASLDWAYGTGIPLSYLIELRGQNFTWPAWRIRELGEEFTNIVTDLCDGAKQYRFY